MSFSQFCWPSGQEGVDVKYLRLIIPGAATSLLFGFQFTLFVDTITPKEILFVQTFGWGMVIAVIVLAIITLFKSERFANMVMLIVFISVMGGFGISTILIFPFIDPDSTQQAILYEKTIVTISLLCELFLILRFVEIEKKLDNASKPRGGSDET